eukprot:244548-Amphidinium_carterae.1
MRPWRSYFNMTSDSHLTCEGPSCDCALLIAASKWACSGFKGRTGCGPKIFDAYSNGSVDPTAGPIRCLPPFCAFMMFGSVM